MNYINENLNIVDGFNTQSKAAKDRMGKLYNRSKEFILRPTWRNKKKEI